MSEQEHKKLSKKRKRRRVEEKGREKAWVLELLR